ncbi:FG-GAP-like repeat-containing protein, partial [Nonomuraea sp. NPDC050786]|uniref:C40 family peptidase n=1 Tax=Nonomuraea sp. NPDC050786 TaxID=3154840 RepID=UPI00340D30DB
MHTTTRLRHLLVTASATLACCAGFAIPAGAAPLPSNTPQPDVSVMFNCGTYAQNMTITRSEVLTRSRTWIDARVPYSQSACHGNQYGSYRTDCSGFVSMAWGLRYSYTTSTIGQVSHQIARSDLQPGDALNRPGEHVALFIGWEDAARTRPVVREQAGPDGAPTIQRTWPQSYAATYTPIRYNNIVDGTTGSGSSLSGDGKAEIVTVLDNGDVKAWRNAAGFADVPWDADKIVATEFAKDNIHFADLDGDGKSELMTVLDNG